MSQRTQNLGLVSLLVLTLALVGWALRRPTVAEPTAAPRVTAGAGSSSPTSTSETVRVVFVGDSFTEGKGATSARTRWTALVSEREGWTEVNYGHAQTGYAQAGRTDSCEGEPCPSFADVVDAVVEADPDIVVVAGGANDLDLSAEQRATAVRSTLGDLRRRLADTRIVVVNPWWDLRPQPDDLLAHTELIRDTAKEHDETWLWTGQPLDSEDLMTTGGIQPNDKGHRALADAFLAAYEKATG